MEWNIGDIVQLDFSQDNFTIMQTCIFENEKHYLIYNLNNVKEMYIIKKMNEDTNNLKIIKDEEKIDKILEKMAK